MAEERPCGAFAKAAARRRYRPEAVVPQSREVVSSSSALTGLLLWNVGVLTTLAHRSFSALMKAANSSGVVGEASVPLSARRAFTSGTCSVLTRVALSLARMGFGTAACVHAPYHTVTSNPRKPDSATVGTWDSCGLRSSVLTARTDPQ